ncbi:MAG: glutaredoxin family protein [Chloroflexota bacterium]|nr:glutaredoxin family protein [Chloroflexota bacterium]
MWTTVVGDAQRGDVTLYALSTCPWCKRAKRLLSDNGVAYRYVDVDLLDGDEAERVVAEISRLNPMRSFPTVIINGKVIAGFQEERIREALGL